MLQGSISVAAQLGDAHGDEAKALKTLESGIERFPAAAAVDRARAYLYRAELAIRLRQHDLASSSLEIAKSIALSDDEQTALAEEFAYAAALVASA